MNRKNITKIAVSLFLCAFLAAFFYSLHFPVSCKVKNIEIIKYKDSYTLNEDIESIRKAIIDNRLDGLDAEKYLTELFLQPHGTILLLWKN